MTRYNKKLKKIKVIGGGMTKGDVTPSYTVITINVNLNWIYLI